MSFGNLLGQILQQGMAQQGRQRLEHAAGAGGIGDLLGAVLGGQAGGRGAAAGGLADALGGLLGGASRAGGGAAATGGLGDLLGGMLGGDGRAGGNPLGDLLGGALGGVLSGALGGRGGASASRGQGNAGMAILATIAMAALKNWTDGKRAQAAFADKDSGFSAQELAAVSAPETEQLILRAMVSAAKADGQVSEDEIQRIIGKIDDDGVSADEKRFLIEALRQPLDMAGLIADVPNPVVAAEVYAASLLAIELDTPAEAAYLRQLGNGLGLDAATISRLHQITGAPQV